MAEVLGKTRISFTASLRVSGKRRELCVGKNSVSVRVGKSVRFSGQKLVVGDRGKGLRKANPPQAVSAKMGRAFRQSLKWWHKGLQPNMKEVTSAEDLVDSLAREGDKLIIVDFFSPGCGGCKALHPKICQFAEMNPEIDFLQVNYEEHKSMCYSLNVHVLPFFRFYRGAHGRLCSFSCTNATINKFRDALAKHTTERCSIGPTRGLEESELLALAANKDLSFSYTAKPWIAELAPASPKPLVPQPSSAVGHEGKTLVTA